MNTVTKYISPDHQIALVFIHYGADAFNDERIKYISNVNGYHGQVKYSFDPNYLRIDVLEAYPNGCGIGPILLLLASKVAEEYGRQRILLTHTNPLAYSFYLRMGFFATEQEIIDILTFKRPSKTMVPSKFDIPVLIDFLKENPLYLPHGGSFRAIQWDGATDEIAIKARHNLRGRWRKVHPFDREFYNIYEGI